jgi:hypothetical protein
MDTRDPRLELGMVQPPAPELAQPRHPPRHQTQTAAGALAGWGWLCRTPSRSPGDHLPIDIVGGAVEIEHRARGVGYDQRRPGLRRNRLAQGIDESVLQPERSP